MNVVLWSPLRPVWKLCLQTKNTPTFTKGDMFSLLPDQSGIVGPPALMHMSQTRRPREACRWSQRPKLLQPRGLQNKEQGKRPTRCEKHDQVDLLPRRSPGSYWLWARKLCQDHSDVTPMLKGHRIPALRISGAYVVKTLQSHATAAIRIQLWETFFTFAWANFSSLLAGRDRDCFCFTFVFVWMFVIVLDP